MRLYKAIVYIASLMFATLARAQETRLLIADTAGPQISRHIYGQFAEHLGRCVYDGIYRNGKIRMDVVEALKKIKVPSLRWPGGCFADQYHWKDGIGTKEKRKQTVNIMWGMVPEDNSFGTDEFMQLCKLIGCQPYLAGNMGSGSPQELEDWVEYCNYAGQSGLAEQRKQNGHSDPYKVPFWGIGNESWGCGGRMTSETYAERYRTFANYVREYPGAPVQRIASGANADDYGWTEYLMGHISPRWMQGIGVHYYTDAGGRTQNFATDFDEAHYFSALKSALNMETIVRMHSAIMDKFDPGKNVALVVDEWGIVVGDDNSPSLFYQQNSLRDALIAATTLNIFNNHADRVRMANLAQMVNVLQSMVLTKGDSILLTPTYHVFDLYQVHQDAKSLAVKFVSPDYKFGPSKIPAINVSASKDSTGAVHISMVNIDPGKENTVRFSLANLPQKTITGKLLTSKRFNDVNTFETPGKVHIVPFYGAKKDRDELVVNLPPKSAVVLELK